MTFETFSAVALLVAAVAVWLALLHSARKEKREQEERQRQEAAFWEDAKKSELLWRAGENWLNVLVRHKRKVADCWVCGNLVILPNEASAEYVFCAEDVFCAECSKSREEETHVNPHL